MGILNVQNVNSKRILLGAGLLVSAIGLGNGVLQFGRMITPKGDEVMGFISYENLNFQGIYDMAVALLVVAIPVALSWYARTYVKSAESQKRIGMIETIASAAINYAEDAERRGELELAYHSLDLPESMARNPSPGNQKLCLASSWLVDEMKRMGLKKVSMEQAARWIAAEFQKNAGDLRTIHSVSALTDLGTDLLRQLSRDGHITLPGNTLETVSLIQSIADWATDRVGDANSDKAIQRDAAIARISPRSLMMVGSSGRSTAKISPEVRLTLLAKQAVDFVAELQAQGKLRMSDKETAHAWLIQQVQQDDIPATPEQIDKAIAKAFEQKRV